MGKHGGAAYWTEEKKKMRKMTKRQAVSYIWTYYRLWILGLVVVGGLVIYFGGIFLNPAPDAVLNLTFVNFYDDVSEESAFTSDFIDTLARRPEEGSVVFDANSFFDLAKATDYKNSYFQKAVAGLEAKTTDGIICQYDNLMGIAQGGRLLDLRDERVASIYEKYSDRLVFYETEDGIQVPVGIDLTDSSMWDKVEGYTDNCYLGISFQGTHLVKVEEFLDYMLEES